MFAIQLATTEYLSHLSKNRISCWVLEVIIGHCTYFALVRRDVLAIFTQHIVLLKPTITPCPSVDGGLCCTQRLQRSYDLCYFELEGPMEQIRL